MQERQHSVICPVCGAENSARVRLCHCCKTDLVAFDDGGQKSVATAVTRTCPRCATVNFFAARVCTRCARELEDVPKAGQAKADDARHPIAQLTLVRRRGDGDSFLVYGPETIVGCNSGPIFQRDPYLTPQHVRFTVKGSKLMLEEVDRLSGTLLRIEKEELHPGDVFRIGRELLRFEMLKGGPGWGRLTLVAGRITEDEGIFELRSNTMTLGRREGDIQFPGDRHVSTLHARVVRRHGGVVELVDLSSREGTFIRLRQARVVDFGVQLVIGQQLFRLDEPPSSVNA